MSYHINATEYNCKNCNQVFIAYSKDLPCPRCKIPEDSDGDSYEFIDNLITSININKKQTGQAYPQAWFIGGLSDFIQKQVFTCVHLLESDKDTTIDKIIADMWLNVPNDVRPDVEHMENILRLVHSRSNEY